MKIITTPHPSLRITAKPVIQLDKKIVKFVADLKATLANTKNPQGVGLAAPQVDKSWRIFATLLDDIDGQDATAQVYINPKILAHSTNQVLGLSANDKEIREEGCLSIPGLYGPVPRYEWVETEFDHIAGDELVTQRKRLTNFAARVFQHELDHLNGILFTDYSLQFDLPVYREVSPDKFEEIDKRILETF